MTLTPDDLRRPAVKRIAHTITVLTTPVWILPALLAILTGVVAFVFDAIAECTTWLADQVMRPIEELKWRAAEALVKRWPTPKPDFDSDFDSEFETFVREMHDPQPPAAS